MKNLITGDWTYGHDNDKHQGKLRTRRGDAFQVHAVLRYDAKTGLVSWNRADDFGRYPDWLDTIEKMKEVLIGNGIKLHRINRLTASRYTYHREGPARFLIYHDENGNKHVLGTANNDWLLNGFNATPFGQIPLTALARMLLPLEEFLKKEYGISE